eukprot:scaffold122706_cov31-Tisochrysis_lutea.AAC.2
MEANAADVDVVVPSVMDAAALAVDDATVKPRGPSRRIPGPVMRVPSIVARPAKEPNVPHCAAPHPRSSRARTCHRSPIPLTADCNTKMIENRRPNAPRWKRPKNTNGFTRFKMSGLRRSSASVSVRPKATQEATSSPRHEEAA